MGGTEAYLMNYYRRLVGAELQIDFAVHGYDKGVYDDELQQNSSVIYRLPVKSDNLLKNLIQMNRVFRQKKYDIVHSHMDAANFVPLFLAKIHHVPVRISHVHTTRSYSQNAVKRLAGKWMQSGLKSCATEFFACSGQAADWLYGGVDKKKISIIPNAISLDAFRFSEQSRRELRARYHIAEGDRVVGHVGRFDRIKNQEFLIHVFEALDDRYKLMLIGDGERFDCLKCYVAQRKITNVIFVGNVTAPQPFYSAFDLFVLPSEFEGFPVTVLEASANGLQCLVSENVTREVNICDNVSFLPLQQAVWQQRLLSAFPVGARADYTGLMTQKGYNIDREAEKLKKRYRQLVDGGHG